MKSIIAMFADMRRRASLAFHRRALLELQSQRPCDPDINRIVLRIAELEEMI